MLVKKLSDKAVLPKRATEKSAGLDLFACCENDIVIKSGETKKVPTGIALALPKNTVGLVYARSGLAVKNGIAPANCVGVIDEDYRGEITVGLYNHSKEDFKISFGDRIAQLVVAPVFYEDVVETEELSETVRGEGGFGSTGK